MNFKLTSLPPIKFKGETIAQIQAWHLPMGPPSPGTDPAAYWSSIARDQFAQFSKAQRAVARCANMNAELLSSEVRSGLQASNTQPINGASIKPTSGIKRAVSVTLSKLERGASSVSRRLSLRTKRPAQKAMQPLAQTPLQHKRSETQTSIVPSLFVVRLPSKPARRVHFDDARLASLADEQLARRATAPTRRNTQVLLPSALRPSRTLPSGADRRPPANAQPVRKEDTMGFIPIYLDIGTVPTRDRPVYLSAPPKQPRRFNSSPNPSTNALKSAAPRTTQDAQLLSDAVYEAPKAAARSQSLKLFDMSVIHAAAGR